ncbi:MAG: BON domain-containing protein, partial [Chitinivibrionales bacterium]|nr:BON domain-containing protein [Chitinivibrionales bacterium]MBD3395141.1 BON domain-containing protein [Chitinivibrionales bacterium]
SGIVGSAAQKSIAYNKSWVAGVKEIDIADVEVQPWARDEMRKESTITITEDGQIEDAVNDALLWDPRTSSFDVTVSAENGLVTLIGVVDNLKAKRAAERDARNTVGVVDVNNYLSVRPQEVADSDIEKRVENALLWDPMVERHEIDAVVRNKKVYLYGDVDSYHEKVHAEDVASRINGVAEVRNSLSVNGTWEWKSDEQVEDAIKSELYWSWYVDESDVEVDVDDGMATLTGTVDTRMELDAAIDNAFDGGAQVVESRLQLANATDPEPFRVYRKDGTTYRYLLLF